MIKLFLVLALLSATAFASEDRILLLEKHTKSGRVDPADSFQKDCFIYRNGDVEVTIKLNETASGFTAKIDRSKVFELRNLIRIARFFPIVTRLPRCDTGEHVVTGYQGMKPVLIKDLRSCNADKYRKGYAAFHLRSEVESICTF
jgi:hypothetical protein